MDMPTLGIDQQYPLVVVFNLPHEAYDNQGVLN